jgi:twinkle protein
LDNCYDEIEKIEKFYIAVDNDEAGLCLKEELIRRLGSEKCWVVDFKDCKDANEFLQKYGAIELSEILHSAKQCDIVGVITAESLRNEFVDLYERGLPHGDKIGLREFDDNVSFIGGQLTMITGVPNHGKSDFVDQIIVSLAIKHGWKFGIYSPENFPIQLHLSKLAEKIIGNSFRPSDDKYGRMSLQHAEKSLEFINEHFFFIQPSDDDMSLDNILEHGKKLVRRYGIKGMVIDPWNKLDHRYTGNETQYISASLDSIIKFNQKNVVHTFVVAHPTKLQKDKVTGAIEIPNLYQISGSAHFYNKCDNGIVVHRFFSDNPEERRTEIHTMKVKFKHLGSQGVATMSYDLSCGRFNCRASGFFDKDNWLKKEEIQTEITMTNGIVQNNNFINEKDIPF